MDELTYEMILKSWKESAKISEVSEDKELDLQCKEMVEKAIEKQIAKKPLAYDDCEQYLVRCTCGKCTDTRFFHGFCTWCGQNLATQTEC